MENNYVLGVASLEDWVVLARDGSINEQECGPAPVVGKRRGKGRMRAYNHGGGNSRSLAVVASLAAPPKELQGSHW